MQKKKCKKAKKPCHCAKEETYRKKNSNLVGCIVPSAFLCRMKLVPSAFLSLRFKVSTLQSVQDFCKLFPDEAFFLRLSD
jgi:hypothetical protein